MLYTEPQNPGTDANRLRHNPETGTTHGKGDHFPL
jgi:hypothetical protein